MPDEDLRRQIISKTNLVFAGKADFRETYGELIELTEKRLEGQRPASMELLVSYGALLSDYGRHPDALEILRRVVLRSPTFYQAYYNLAVAMMNVDGHRPRAREYFEKALEFRRAEFVLEAYFDPQAH